MSDKYQERFDRIMAAVRLEPVDRIPVMQSGSACNAVFCGKKRVKWYTMPWSSDASQDAMASTCASSSDKPGTTSVVTSK